MRSPGFLHRPRSRSYARAPRLLFLPLGREFHVSLYRVIRSWYYEFRNIIILATCFRDIEFQEVPAASGARAARWNAQHSCCCCTRRANLPEQHRVAINAGDYTAVFATVLFVCRNLFRAADSPGATISESSAEFSEFSARDVDQKIAREIFSRPPPPPLGRKEEYSKICFINFSQISRVLFLILS